MTYQICITDRAEKDLRNIFEYVAFELQEMQVAVGLLARLEEEINSLSYMPERYRLYDREPWRSRNLHIMPVENYLVFYIPDAITQKVSVVRVFYGRRDIAGQLSQID